MDHHSLEMESRQSHSFGRLSAANSSRRQSLSSAQYDDTIESESVSEAGDIGDRILHSNRCSASGRSHFSLDNGSVVPIQDNILSSTSLPSHLEKLPSPSVDLQTDSEENKKVLARYCLQKLFGPGVIGATSDGSYMYLDLPSNMVGSFLMGWFGVVFKGDISMVSDQLAIGLTTGFLGSLTTFSGWNQKVLDLCIEGHWIFAALAIFIGLFLVAYSIIFGIETAKGFRWLCKHSNIKSFFGIPTCLRACNLNKSNCLLTIMAMFLLMLGLLWGLFGALAKNNFESGGSKAQLFLACMVGPFGVWMRWFLARFNGRGLGIAGHVKWMPLGTLAANVLAASLMAALTTLKKTVKTKSCDTAVSGIQFGLLGCLSTVSTFIAEFHAMRESLHPWRAYAYAMVTFVLSFLLGTLVYLVPGWTRGYD
ncbi:fluoride export protein 1 isoform X2 [Andrographis paniculata]|uniref:fluoride export protein 1 isoform X2 n=1 Tax=Andrographis paniculata TaxID=175694 RepID=UPI0021E6EFCF|nr:fluoride export protein 1 isoform X2 [Andrographis paniculata]